MKYTVNVHFEIDSSNYVQPLLDVDSVRRLVTDMIDTQADWPGDLKIEISEIGKSEIGILDAKLRGKE